MTRQEIETSLPAWVEHALAIVPRSLFEWKNVDNLEKMLILFI